MAKEHRFALKIKYKNNNGDDLGCYEYTNFEEVLTPDFNTDFDYFINIKFANHSNFVWKILSVVCTANNLLTITLEAIISNSHTLGHLTTRLGINPDRYVQEYSIVEVEFGFFERVYNGQGFRKNNKYTNSLLSGEIHKRRPCILYSLHGKFAQVIPLTTKSNKLTRYDIPVDLSVIKDLHSKYHCPTFALPYLLQPVSFERIYAPILTANGASFSRNQILSKTDRATLKNVLSSSLKFGTDIKVLNTQVTDLKTERSANLTKITELTANLKDMSNYLLELGEYVGETETGNLNEIIEGIISRREAKIGKV